VGRACSGVLERPEVWIWGTLGALLIGVAKTGFSGASLLAVAIFTQLFGPKVQAGLVLPLLLFADLLVYPAFLRHGSWREVLPLLPATLVGIGLGWWGLATLSVELSERLIGISILAMLALVAMRLVDPEKVQRLASHRVFGTGAGVAGGATSALANGAGPIIHLYLLSREVPKMELIGIGARFFLLINVVKMPLNWSIGLIHRESLTVGLVLAPGVVVGVFAGRWLLRRVPQRLFEWLVIGSAALAAGRMLW